MDPLNTKTKTQHSHTRFKFSEKMLQQTLSGGLFGSASPPPFLQVQRLPDAKPRQLFAEAPEAPKPFLPLEVDGAQKLSHLQSMQPTQSSEAKPVKSKSKPKPRSAAEEVEEVGDGSEEADEGDIAEGDEEEGEEGEEVVSESELPMVKAPPGAVIYTTGAWRGEGASRRQVKKPVNYQPIERVEDDYSDGDSEDIEMALKYVSDVEVVTEDEEGDESQSASSEASAAGGVGGASGVAGGAGAEGGAGGVGGGAPAPSKKRKKAPDEQADSDAEFVVGAAPSDDDDESYKGSETEEEGDSEEEGDDESEAEFSGGSESD